MKEALRVLGYEEDEEVGEAFMMLTSTQLTSAGLNVREANAILAKAAPPTDQMRTVIREELVRHDESQSKSNKSFSEVGSSEVDSLLVELNLNEVDGNAVEPIIVPADAPQPGSFAYENYPDENTGTPFLLAHHQKELERHDVHFGRNDFKMYDIHSERKMYGITARSGQRYNGSLDGCAAPYGLMASSAGLHSRLAYKHKQNEAQKQIYRDKHSDHYQIRGDEVYVWTDLTAAQAYFKQAELLKSLPTHLPNRQLKMEAIPEELQVPLKKMRTLRTRSGVVEQLSSVLPCLPPSERLSGAYDIINTWVSAAAAAAPLP
ncbi:hypothetical protein COCSUDRAFT_83503 [Coccomyxa subellipsoidea C-169]|uniref:Uncharacterized protein n=1 Tax=Coccomyxa subellipsoidea (strain C-169) TaxID=574566 RepID=I0YTJ6_COCSC|nr:hypothetical protein COCSUDRAFT_83503 [Coccomyxa subellipsoidea C-169]EIE21715.1 hypothetical protein COCSUDRAFT_83503 [Coccomyxa subellipsoidea C-169]|eukprot:XP_005646259.1 hypothetical protein COCSUDRAFT_83503 [Coccomyxa subellipsoidea C-169]